MEGRFCPRFLVLAVELRLVLFASAVHVLSRLAIVGSTFEMGSDTGGLSSPKAAQARYSIAYAISSAADCVVLVSTGYTLLISTFIAIEWVCVHQCSLQSFACSFNDLNWIGFSATSSHLLLLALHQFFKL